MVFPSSVDKFKAPSKFVQQFILDVPDGLQPTAPEWTIGYECCDDQMSALLQRPFDPT